MPPSRLMPRVGMRAYAGDTARPLTVVRVEGVRVVVLDHEDGQERAFALHRLTGHWVLEGEPYWGLRLRLAEDDPVCGDDAAAAGGG